MSRWGFTDKTHIVWYKTRKDGGPDGRGAGCYFRKATEMFARATRDGWKQWGNEVDKNGTVDETDREAQLQFVMETRGGPTTVDGS